MIDLLGPQVAIIDDRIVEVQSIIDTLQEMHVGTEFFEVDFAEPHYPPAPLNTIKLVFLDLHYNTNYGSGFDPYACIQWIQHIVPQYQKYILIIWSRDIEKKDELLEVMSQQQMTMPYLVEAKQKEDYQQEANNYNIPRLLEELGVELEKINYPEEEYYGKILESDESTVLINCLIDQDPNVFEVRRFDINPFLDFIDLYPGRYIKIKISTKPGTKTINYFPIDEDISELFVKPDDPTLSENLAWLRENQQ